MQTLAAASDTWGIPGPTFLFIYLVLAALVLVAAALHARAVTKGTRGAQVDRLHPQQVAYLNGGDQLAVYAALGGLRAAGSVSSGPDRTLYQSGPMPAGATPIDTAVYNAAGQRVRGRDLPNDQWVRASVRDLAAGLETAGLAVPPSRQRPLRVWAYAELAVLLFGVARLVDGLQNDKPVFFLIFALFFVVILVVRLFKYQAIRTSVASKGLAAMRRSHDYLSPRSSPAYATYGAAGVGMGVALFGTAALFSMDPAFAADSEIQRVLPGSSGWDSSSGGSASSCSSGSSCSSSSSCSSGSSCGGGGGGCGG